MKRIPITMLLCLCGLVAALADQVVTRDADIIECEVTSIDDTFVRYRKAGERFDREIKRGDVFKIKYDNGEEEMFCTEASSPLASGGLAVASGSSHSNTETEPDWNAFPPASRQYHIGDWYSENGVEGIVIWTTPDGRHGRILHKKKFNTSKFHKPAPFFSGPADIPLGMGDTANGHANLLALRRFIGSNPQYTPEMFPINQILEQLGNGWYLPAIRELEYLEHLRDSYVTYSGENSQFNGKTVKWHKILNHVSKSHGGDKHDDYYRLSSTEVYSSGGASATFETLYGDPQSPQFALLKRALDGDGQQKPFTRTRGLPFFAFHLF